MKRKRKNYEYSREELERNIIEQAQGLRMPKGWAETIAKRVANATDRWIEDKDIVTEEDLRIFVCKQLEQVAPDIAFVYHNRDKII